MRYTAPKKYEIDEALGSRIEKLYLILQSCYKVAKQVGFPKSPVQAYLKSKNLLNSQSEAAKQRNLKPEFKQAMEKRSNNQTWKDAISKTRIERKIPSPNKGKSKYNGSVPRRPHNFKDGEWAKLRNACFNRDKYTCQECNKKGRLHAHHVLPFYAVPEAFSDIDNLMTLCTDCHLSIGHNGVWKTFNVDLVSPYLMEKYNLHAERLNDLASLNLKKVRKSDH